jgi:protein involved in polysaccharide export with SLBB domain
MTAPFQRLVSGQRSLLWLVIIAIGACALPLAGQQPKLPEVSITDLIRPGDWLSIQVVGTLPDAPIKGPYQVEASGKVALGPEYGRVQFNGKTLEQAETILSEHLARLLAAAKPQITRYESPPRPARAAVQALERRVDKLEKEVQRLQTVANTPSK